jgi:hypothetical protein
MKAATFGSDIFEVVPVEPALEMLSAGGLVVFDALKR